MAQSNFHQDMNREGQLGRALDIVFYPILLEQWNEDEKEWSIRREIDPGLQKQGVDLTIYNTDGEEYHIDEKAQITPRYMNGEINLKTFVFELKNGRSSNIGWFLDNTNTTTHYFLYRQIHADESNNNWNITRFIMDSVKVENLKVFLTRLGLDNEFLTQIKDGLTKNSAPDILELISKPTDFVVKYKIKKLEERLQNIIRVTQSPQLAENPVNLLINIEKVSNIPEAKGLFTRFNFPFTSQG